MCYGNVFAQQIRFTINGQTASSTQAILVCENTPVAFVNASAAGLTNPTWAFKGGTPNVASGNNATSRFPNLGIDSVTLTLSRIGLSDTSLTVPIQVVANTISANFSSSPSGLCANEPVSFTNLSTTGAGIAYNWNFNDPNSGTANNTSSQTNPTHRFVGTPGNNNQIFNVRLIARNNIGCADTANKDVTVRRLPGTQLEAIDVITYEGKPFFRICTSDPSGEVLVVNKSTTTNTNTNYQIIWGNGDPDFLGTTLDNQTRTYPVGIYNLSFIVSGGNGCKDTAQYGVFVGSNPAVGLNNPGNTSICTGSSLTFPITTTASNPPGTFYTVTFNDGSAPVQFEHPAPSSVTHQFDVTSCGTVSGSFANSFQATITATNPCLSSQSNVVPIYVSEKARAIMGISPSDTVCTGINVSVNDNSGNISFISGNTCSGGRRVWTITPSTGFTLNGTLGNDAGFPLNPNVWTTGSAALNLNFTQPGVYTIKLRVGNQFCGRDSVIRTICVNPAPTANFTTSTLTGCAPLTVNTTNLSIAATPICDTNTYQWAVSYSATPGCSPSTSNFTLQDGTTLTSVAPIFSFNNPGTYTLSLVTRNAKGICQSAAFSRQIVVKEKPNANFSLPLSVCQGTAINISSNSNNCGGTTATSFNWVFPGGSPANATVANPGNVQFNNVGTQEIQLTATNECGSTVVTRPLPVNPTPEITVPDNSAICRGQTAGPFTFSTQPTANVTWANNNIGIGIPASGTGNINAFTPTNSGTATITATPAIGNCSGTPKSFTLTVHPLPAGPVATTQITYCVGDESNALTATPLPNHTLSWYTTASGGTPLPSAPVPPTTTTGNTSWWVSQVNNSTNCESPRTQVTVTVFPIPSLTDAVGTNPTTCAAANGSILLIGLQPNTNYAVSYTRNGALQTVNLTSNASGNITIAALSAGVYDNIRVSVGGGCLSLPKGPVSLSDPNPPATPEVTGNGPLCTGNTLNLTALSATPGAIIYNWSGPNGFNSNAQNPFITNITLAAAGTYSVTARLGNCTSPAGTVQVVVNPTPTVTATSNSPVCSGNPINLLGSTANPGITFSWTGPDNFSSNEQNSTIANATVTNSGTYRLTGTINGCTAPERTIAVIVNPTPVIADAIPSNPTNCASANGSIQLTGLSPNTSFSVSYSRDGAPITTTISSNAAGNLTIPNLAAGTYSNIRVTVQGCTSGPLGPVSLSDPNPPAAPIVGSNSPLCIGSTIQLTATGVGTGTYQWTGPNAFISTQQNPVINNAQPENAGVYSVRFTVNSCVSAPATVTVAVSQNASLANAGPNQELCNTSGTRLQGVAPSNGTGIWTVLPGSDAQVANPGNPASDVTNLSIGLTRLVWTVTNNVCPPGSDTMDIVNLPPVLQAIDPKAPVICAGQSISLTGTNPTGGTGNYVYQWQLSTNNIAFTNIANETGPNYLAAPVTNTWYRRQVTSGACLHFSDTILVTVRPALSNNQIAGPAEVCINTVPALISGSNPTGGEGNYLYTWELSLNGGATWTVIPNETSRDYQPPALTQTTAYRRIVSTALCQGPQSLASNIFTIIVRPDALLSWQPAPLTGCTPFEITHARLNLTHLEDRNTTYRWFVNGAQVGTGLTFPGHTVANPGDSAVVKAVAVSLFGCRNDSASVTFNTIGNPAPSFTLSDTVGCGPIDISITNTTPNLSGFTYRWDFGSGQQSNAANPGTVTFARNPDFGDTLYNVILYASNGCDTLTASKTIRVRAPAKAIINPDKVEGCSPARFTFTNNSRGSGATFTWNFGDGSPDLSTDEKTVSYTYNTGVRRIYAISLISRNDCGTDTARVNLVVSPNPIQVNLLADVNRLNGCVPHTVQFINNTIGASTFRYNFGDGSPEVISGRQFDTLFHTYQNPGTFTFNMTAGSGCTDTSIQRTVVVEKKPTAAFTRNPGVVCIGEPVNFTNNSTAGAAVQWSFGDGTGSGLANPEKRYTSAGTFRVTLYASTTFGQGFSCTDSATATVIVRDTLPGNFTVENTGNCAPFAITFKTGLATSVATFWDFGDGNTATGDSVAHSYLSSGNYTVTMVSRDAGGCAYKRQQTVTVGGPSGTLNYAAPFVCFGNATTFRATSNNTARYIYYFGNGDSIISLNNQVNYTYPQPGVYLPKVILQSGNCRSEITGRDSIKVDRVVARFGFASTPSCGFTTLRFTDSASAVFGKGIWAWQFGDGNSSNQQNPNHIYRNDGLYQVKLIATGLSGCKDSMTTPIRVDVEKIPLAGISGDTIGCIGQTLQWRGSVQNVTGDVSYRWLLGDGRELTGSNITSSYNRGGFFNMRLIVQSAFGCLDTASRLVDINLDPLIHVGPDLQICRGKSRQLRATGAVQYEWMPSTGLSCANCPNPIVLPTENISYTITGFNAIGCSAKDTLNIEVPQPFRITYSNNDTICLGGNVQLNAGGAQRYTWSPALGLNSANIPNPVASPQITTTYRVIGTDNANCFADTGYVTVEVGRIPTVSLGNGGSFVAGTQIKLNPQLGNGPFARYVWTPATGLSCSNCPNPVVTVETNITYRLQVTSPLGCSGSDTISFRALCVQAEQVYIPNAFSPDGDGVNDIFMVRGKGLARVKSFRVFNRFGQLVFERQNFMANDPANGWDGKIQGVPASPDVYVFIAELLCTGGSTYFEKGNVTLVR